MSLPMDDVTNDLRRFIVSRYLIGERPENVRNDTPLQTSGILDSLATEGLVSFVQQQFGVELDVYETSVDKFNRIEEIAASVRRKQALRLQPLGGPPE